jgi:mycothiol synthase
MRSITSRNYAGTADLQAMIDLLSTVRPAARITDYPSIVDLREMLGVSDTQANTRLWEDADGRLVSFALLDSGNGLFFEIRSQVSGGDIESQMIAWGVERVQHTVQEHGEPIRLNASCRDDDTARIALLKQHGFAMRDLRSLKMTRSLERVPEPQVPAGFNIRHTAGEHEVEALVALHRAAFGTERMTVEYRRAMMREPSYSLELDLVAVAPDGTLAAYCTCSISEEENACTGRNEGYVDTIGTHPRFQRRGLARALLWTELHLLEQRGMQTAVLGTSSENFAMQQLARAAGFRTLETKVWFNKQVSQV